MSGLWYNGPEASRFLPCEMYDPDEGSEWIIYGQGYWLDTYEDASAGFVEQVDAQTSVDVGYDTVVYIRIEGRLSDIGRFGHLAQYEREVTPTRLIEIRATEACPAAAGSG